MAAIAAGAADRAVVARNFPQAWIQPAALDSLPQKVQSLLQRIGPLDAPPAISPGPAGLEALAYFQSKDAAQHAVQTLHDTDLRTSAEKKAANYEPPKESERFWLRIATDAGRVAVGAPAGAPPQTQAPVPGVDMAPRRSRVKPNGVYLSPLPKGWGESDVKILAGPYGPVSRVIMRTVSDGVQGALIDYQGEAAAAAALVGLNGLSLMGARLSCVRQEELEPERPLLRFVIFFDELVSSPQFTAAAQGARASAPPRLDDREVFLHELPRGSRTEEAAKTHLAGFGEVTEVFLILNPQLQATGRAYARFRSHMDALRAIKGIQATSPGQERAAWSESERVFNGAAGPYGLDILRRLSGGAGAGLLEIRKAAQLGALTLAGPGTGAAPTAGSGTEAHHLHFVVKCEHPSQAEKCRGMLAAELAKAYEAYAREVRGSLVLRGFPASWSEKGLKFVFAPFGGLASVALEEEKPKAGEAGGAVRVGYIKLRNEGAMEKAVSNLHMTKVGDGDLVEECVVACQHWHLRGWSDGSALVGFYVDELIAGASRRPLNAEPGSEDRELYVQNLPLSDMNRQQLQEYFEGFGEVEDLHLIERSFSEELTGDGYVRFKSHRDAQRCIEALTPANPAEADPTDLTGSWSESERVQQRKANCYRFNIIAELVGADGSGLRRIKEDAKLKSIWVMAESLQQKDRHAPPLLGRQLQVVGRVADEAHAKVFKEILQRTLESIHGKIAGRIEKRRKKAEAAANADKTDGATAPVATTATPARPPAVAATATPPAAAPQGGGQAPAWSASVGSSWAAPPVAPAAPAAPDYWGSAWGGAPLPGPPGYPGVPPPAGQMPPPPGAFHAPAPQASVFEMGSPSAKGAPNGGDDKARSRSRRRKHRSGGDGGDKERHRRRRRGGDGDDGGSGDR